MALQMKVTLSVLFLFAFVAGVISVPQPNFTQLNDMTKSLTVEKNHFDGSESLLVTVELTNDSPKSGLFLPWNTPFEGMKNNIFEVIHEETGEAAVYVGRLTKRAEPTTSDFVRLAVGESMNTTLDLAESYKWLHDGVHIIRVNSHVFAGQEFVTNEIRVLITKVTPYVAPEFSEDISFAIGFDGCNSTRQTTINKAVDNARIASSNAVSYLTKNCQPTYVTWFGTYSSTNYDKVSKNFNNIKNKIAGTAYRFDCTCNDAGVYAYVYPSDPTSTIHLCPEFWKASTLAYAYNSQPGTITHEMSHFTAVAGTQDYQYGTTGCQSLAKSNPSRAIANADNYEYFQESKPTC